MLVRVRKIPVVTFLLLALAQLPAATARAQYVAPFSPVYVVVPDRSMLSIDGQYFAPSPRGARDLCQLKTDLCARPGVQDELQRLRHREVTSWVLAGTGLASTLAGMGLAVGGTCADSGNTRSALLIAGGSALGVGIILSAVGWGIAPDADAMRRFVNTVNNAPGGERIEWHLGMGPTGLPEVLASVRF